MKYYIPTVLLMALCALTESLILPKPFSLLSGRQQSSGAPVVRMRYSQCLSPPSTSSFLDRLDHLRKSRPRSLLAAALAAMRASAGVGELEENCFSEALPDVFKSGVAHTDMRGV